MKRKTLAKVISVTLAAAMILSVPFSLAGCGKEEEPEDKVTTISVTAQELAPEITDEDLGITRKDPDELLKITGYRSWEGYNFLVLSDAKGTNTTTVQVEDGDLFRALYDARLKILVDVSYASVDQDDPMYSAYAKGLRSLGENFYSLEAEQTERVQASAEDGEADKKETDAMLPGEDVKVADVPAGDGTEETEDTDAGTEDADVSDEEAGEVPDGTDEDHMMVNDDGTNADAEDTEEETAADDKDPDIPEFQTREEAESGGLEDKNNAENVMAEGKKAEEELKAAIEEYMQSVSLNRATRILVFAPDGELLGEMTPAKINDYAAAFEIDPTPYEGGGDPGVVYVSDLDDGIEYLVEGAVNSETDYAYTVKNDTGDPVIIYTASETSDKSEVIFKTYMTTTKSTGWYLVENEYSFTSTDPEYRIRIEHRNSDADLVKELPESAVLTVDEIKADVMEEPSGYQAILNTTDQELYIEADTGDAFVLGSRQAVGVHKSAYDSLELYFEGAKGDHEDNTDPENTEDIPEEESEEGEETEETEQ